jgi:mono/diheme cytochrome c family protein
MAGSKTVAIGALAATFVAAAAWAAPQDQPSVARGLKIAQDNCAACHAIGPSGTSPNPLSPPFRELGRKYAIDDLQEALAEGIVTGHPAMPQFEFTPERINDLIAYLKTIQDPAPKPVGSGG